MSELTAEDLESMDNADVDWVETVRALQAENKRLTAERDAALATTPTAHARLAAARKGATEATTALRNIEAKRRAAPSPRMKALTDEDYYAARAAEVRAYNALAEAEREAGVGRS